MAAGRRGTSGGMDGSPSEHRCAVDRLVDALRSRYVRVLPVDLLTEMEAGALVVDTRPVDQRSRDGELPGAVWVDRNVLEWRLDPTSAHRLPVASSARRTIIVCNEGYSSTLAAASLQALGVAGATDLVDGFQGLLAAGVLPALRDRYGDGEPITLAV